MVPGGSKEVQTALSLVILRVFQPYLQFHFRVKVICKLPTEERTCKLLLANTCVFLLNPKLDFSKW